MYPAVPSTAPASVPPTISAVVNAARAGRGRFRQAEIENLDLPVLEHEHVLGLQIAMHDAPRMRRFEPARECVVMAMAFGTGNGPPERRSRRVCPSSSSVTA